MANAYSPSLNQKPWFLSIIYIFCLVILHGCASTANYGSKEIYTNSDEPETRKRASNRLQLAVLYFNDGKTNIALDEVKQAITADPQWFESYNMIGLIYMKMGDFELADQNFQKALAINSESAEIKHNYAVLMCKRNRLNDALKFFEAAIATPNYAQKANSWQEHGMCLLANGRKNEAEISLKKSYSLDSESYQSAYNIASLLYQKNDDAAALLYIRKINNSEQATSSSLWLGMKIHKKLKNYDSVSQLGTQLKKRFPEARETLAFERGAYEE
jgi:type IV pilus assembly protein PilF